MSAQTVRQARIASPKRAGFKKHTPKPILKRPSPLNLGSPLPFTTHITIVVSPSPAVSSPHVQFAASPVLTAIFSTHSPNSYDRSSTIVVPNPVELPAWGQRVYSPGADAFSSVKSPAPTVPVLFINAPEEAAAKPEKKKKKKVDMTVGVHSPLPRARDLGKSLTVYPRSPYPSAPTSGSPALFGDKENENALGVTRAKSLDSPTSKTKKRAMRRPAALNVPAPRPAAARISSPLANQFLSPVVESPRTVTLQTTARAANRLSQEFWQSVSLEDDGGEHVKLSALECHDEGHTPVSAIPHFVFGTKDGMLWSPGLPPKMDVADAQIRSPDDATSFEFVKPEESDFINSPRDVPATYPTIASVLAMDSTAISYPPPVVNREGSL